MPATIQQNVRIFGAARGAAGVSVVERSGQNALQDPTMGTVMFLGPSKRGVMGHAVPFDSQAEYRLTCGDPKDPTWHLYRDGSQLMPDAIDGFYATGGGQGRMWVIRLDLDGSARRSELILRNRLGAPALKVMAANEGRWGGQKALLDSRPLIYATMRTFTIVAPKAEANEFVGAEARFKGSAKTYVVVSNTKADPQSGETVFTLGAQFNLIADGISGPTTLTGLVDYDRYETKDGTLAFDQTRNLTGTVNVRTRRITGQGTAFMDELNVGESIYINGEARVVDSISSNTTMTISEPFSQIEGDALTVAADNVAVSGVGTDFVADLEVGQIIYATVNGERQGREIASIVSDTELTLTSGFEANLNVAQFETDGMTLVGTDTAFLSELQPGSYVVDPNRAGDAVKVLSVESDTSATLEQVFTTNFANAQITKQAEEATVELKQNGTNGIAIRVGQGLRYPNTHFSIEVLFNGSSVYNVADASLDRDDPFFVEPLVNDDGRNIAYRTGATNFQRWITVESLWDSLYTTSPEADVRPCNGSGLVLAMTSSRLYTVGDFDYGQIVGHVMYPDPYTTARSFVRVVDAKAPVDLQGTFSTLGVTVTGVATTFEDELEAGDYLYDSASGEARKIRRVDSDTSVILETAFSSNVAALTPAMQAGWLEIGPGVNLELMTAVGTRFMVEYPDYLGGGYDGNPASIIPYYYTKFADPDDNMIENAVWGRNAGLIRMACPGVSDVAVQKAFSAYAEATAYEFRAEIPSNYLSAATAEGFVNQELGRNDFQSAAFPSYGFTSDPLGAGDRFISLSGDIMGGESAQAVLHQGYHFPFAGVNARLSRILKLPFEVKPREEAIINLAGIQPIKEMYGNIVVFGARNTAISSVYDFLHIRRQQSSYIRQFLEARELLEQLFKPNQPWLLDNIIMVLNHWARREFKKGVFTQYLSFRQAVDIQGGIPRTGVINDADTAVGLVDIINGRLHIYVTYVPTGVLEELTINIGPEIVTSEYGNTLQGATL